MTGAARRPWRLAVVGGGLTGLSAAYYAQRMAQEQGRGVEITLIEASERLGGRIETLRRDGFVIEKGPDSFLARKQPMLDLAEELGLTSELVRTNPEARKTYIYNRGRLHAMPAGLVLGVPTDLEAFGRSELLTEAGKARVLQDLELPPQPGDTDESVGDFLERRIGAEAMERIAEPLLAGIYAGDLRGLGLRATFPQFRDAELRHGSLIRGMQASRKVSPPQPTLPDALKGSLFLTYRRGLSSLVEALEAAMPRLSRRLACRVEAIRRSTASAYELELQGGERLEADAVVLTAPAPAAAALLRPLTDTAALDAVRYVSVANVVLAFDRTRALRDAFDGSGFLVPRTEGRTITACTWTSAKWLHSSPPDKALLRCYVGRAGDEAPVELDDDELVARVRSDMREIMGIDADPLFAEITRLRRSMPQYPVGHVEQTAAMRARLAQELPGLWVTGAAFDGVGLADCIRQGKEAAAALLARLNGL
ncbi:protoporphyrinogen oxidase [Paenibacillus sp. IB182496]|uniref:Coproporphyrinogen III oxidase n=1 Tax=Paenibacillus sabuli TaxID=2772509 RepID=A0A927BTJ3_9BACL|nr:protoporphyrinogen oxidase [Paenibacillus sabuli]MBD2846022.1 protoporphyrinogen oxidase [Paenibacillus sabuli]